MNFILWGNFLCFWVPEEYKERARLFFDLALESWKSEHRIDIENRSLDGADEQANGGGEMVVGWWWVENLKWIRRSEKGVWEMHFMTNQISIQSRIIMNIREFNSEKKI